MTEDEVAANLPAVLDLILRSDTAVAIVRDGRRIAVLGRGPDVHAANGAAVCDFLMANPVDADFARDVRRARSVLSGDPDV